MEVESSGSSSKDIKLGVRVPKIGDYPSGSSEESSRAIPFMTYSIPVLTYSIQYDIS
jgi:hypothetical protein